MFKKTNKNKICGCKIQKPGVLCSSKGKGVFNVYTLKAPLSFFDAKRVLNMEVLLCQIV